MSKIVVVMLLFAVARHHKHKSLKESQKRPPRPQYNHRTLHLRHQIYGLGPAFEDVVRSSVRMNVVVVLT